MPAVLDVLDAYMIKFPDNVAEAIAVVVDGTTFQYGAENAEHGKSRNENKIFFIISPIL